jgi:arabinofuranosyltransferase
VQTPTVTADDAVASQDAIASRTVRESTAHRIVRWGLLATPVIILVERAWALRWMSDDGFINLRVVSQLVNGHGPVFNIGERVETSTSPFWIFMLATGDILTPVRLEWIAVLLGIVFTLVGIAFAILGARVLVGQRSSDELFIPVGAAVLVAYAPLWLWASSGLENGLAFGWLGVCLWALARSIRGEQPLPAWSAVVLGLGPLIRPEFALYSALFLAAILVGRRHEDRWRDRVALVAWALALPVAYQIFRMGYYGSLVPNPALAKEASGARWGDGWSFLGDTVRPYALWLPLVLLAVGAYLPLAREARAERRTTTLLVAGAFAIGGLIHALYTVRVGGDFMHARLLLPSLFALAAPVAVVPLRRAYAASLLVVPWAIVALLFLRTDADRPVIVGGKVHENPITLDDVGWDKGAPALGWLQGDGVYFSQKKLAAEPVAGRRLAVASYGLGIPSYALGPDTYVLDLLGLGDQFTSHLELERRGLIGHEKPLPAPWIVARLTRPGASLSASDFKFPGVLYGARRLDKPRGIPFEQRVTIARASLNCPELRDFVRSYSAPLTVGRFFGNLFDSLHNTRLRIPPEPADAYEEFCGRPPSRAPSGR